MVETRSDNSTKRPGLVDAPTKTTRRTPAQAAAARLEKQQQKADKAAAKVAAQAAQAQRLEDVTASASAEDAAYATPATSKTTKKRKALARTESVDFESLLAQEDDEMDGLMQPPPPPVIQQSKQKPAVKGASTGVTHGHPKFTKSRRTSGSALPRLGLTLTADAGGAAVAPAQQNIQSTKYTAPAKAKASAANPRVAQSISKDRTFAQAASSAARTGEDIPARAFGLNGQPIGFRVRPPSKAEAKASGGRQLDNVMTAQDDRHSRPSPPAAPSKPNGATNRAGTTAANTDPRKDKSRQRKADAPAPEDSVTEDDSPGALSNSETEDDSQGIKFVPNAVGSETEQSDQPPPKKRSKMEQKDIKGKAKEGGKVERARQGGELKKTQESSDVEIVEEKKIDRPVKKAVPVKKRSADPTAPANRSSNQKPKDKIDSSKGAGGVRCVSIPF